jgi:preprotein translocase subunit YajC
MFALTQLAVIQFQTSNPVVGNLVMVAAMVGIFYFLLIRPAQTRQKRTQEMLNTLKNGDKVITSGGLYGTIVGIENDSIQLRIADQVKVKVLRSAVTGLQPDGKEES